MIMQYAGKKVLSIVAQWKKNAFENQTTKTKEEPVHYINTQGRSNYANDQVS